MDTILQLVVMMARLVFYVTVYVPLHNPFCLGPKGLGSSAFHLQDGFQGTVHKSRGVLPCLLTLGRKVQDPLDVITKTPDASPLKVDYAKAVQKRCATECDLAR